MKHKRGVKGEGEDTLEARLWKGKHWDICCLERGTKAASDGKVWAPTDITPIKEGAEQTGSCGKEQCDRITQRDEDGRREGCRVNVWNESSGGRGEYGTETQSEQRKNKVFLFDFFSTEKRLTKTPHCFQEAFLEFLVGCLEVSQWLKERLLQTWPLVFVWVSRKHLPAFSFNG